MAATIRSARRASGSRSAGSPGRIGQPTGGAPSGEIGRKWRSLGGPSWGTPIGGEQPTQGGVGLVARFQLSADRSIVTIVSSTTAGAKLVSARIGEAWQRNARQLGNPTSEELETFDGVGRYQVFSGGVVVWHPETGAHEVRGEINQRYIASNGTDLGYPVTDETETADGLGRFVDLRNLSTGGAASIYWSASTGAWAVAGAIRTAWMHAGSEHGRLGYPVGAEQPVEWRRPAAGRYQLFQRGLLVHCGGGATVASIGSFTAEQARSAARELVDAAAEANAAG